MMSRNILNKNQYVISKQLHYSLLQGKLPWVTDESNQIVSKKKGVYLVSFRYLNKDKNTVVYNYIYYDIVFLYSIINFLPYKNVDSVRYFEWGDTFVAINEGVFQGLDYNDKRLYPHVTGSYDPVYSKYLSTSIEDFDTVFDEVNNYYIDSQLRLVISAINKLNKLVSNNEMLDIFKYAIEKNSIDFIISILNPLYDAEYIKKKLGDNDQEETFNLINSCIFVVGDIDLFIQDLIKLGYNVNEGPQKWRGQVNSINGLLTTMDMDFRNSLYNHNLYHVKKGHVHLNYKLDKSLFSFRNVHMNLGNVRWYSTNERVMNSKYYSTQALPKKSNPKNISQKLLKRVSTKSFAVDSEIFLYLSRYIKESPINEETQRNIEKFLLDYSYMAIENKDKSKSFINYDLFKHPIIKKYIVEGHDKINDYINNFIKKSYKITDKSAPKTIRRHAFQSVLNVIGSSIVVEVALGMVVRVINNINQINEDCNETNICIEIGDTLIKNYFYTLYKNKIKEDVLIFNTKCLNYINLQTTSLDETNKLKLLNLLEKINKNINKLDVYELFYKVRNILSLIKDSGFIIEDITQYTLSDWKLDNKDVVSMYEKDSSLKLSIGGIIIEWLFDSNLLKQTLVTIGRNNRVKYLLPHNNISKLLKSNDIDKIKHLPLRIPMLVKPKEYYRDEVEGKIKERLGGYLLNDERVTDEMIIPNWELRQNSLIKNPNIIYDLVNNVNSVGFKINIDLLDFINLYADKLNLLLSSIDLKKEISKISPSDHNELVSYQSKLELQENILGLAKVFSDVPEFYLPVRIDFRGRVNCISQYLNYQSTELAKSLLLFSKNEKIMKSDELAIKYFKAYGANCFGNKLDKKSWAERCKWIDDNEADIINYTNCNLISKAENKLLFSAFCIEYNKWIKALNNNEISYFETHLPIQLDATCNGYQHLSLLIYDYDMAKELNLAESNWNDIPKDFYGFMITELINFFKKKLSSNKLLPEDKICYERLVNILIHRSAIKKAVMTIPYNVSVHQMIKYIKEHFIKINENENNYSSPYTLEYQYLEDSNVILCEKDIAFIASGLREVLEINFPRLKLLIWYLKSIANICNKLNIVIPWETPSSLQVNQSYKAFGPNVTLRPYSYNKSSFTLKVTTNSLRGNKQLRSLMPNLIHSLDATVLALLADNLFNNIESKIVNFYSIHDCFAVTANNIVTLFNSLKSVYTKIYIQDVYLRDFDNFIKLYIKLTYGKECFNDDTLKITVILNNNEEIVEQFPNINHVLGTELPPVNLILKSSYLMS